MRRTTPATMQDVKDVEDRLTDRIKQGESRQENYEKKCEEDRAALRGEVHDLHTSVQRIEEKTDNQTSMIQPLAEMFKGILANPKVQTAVLGLVLTTVGYMTYVVHDMLKHRQEPQQQQPQIIVIPQTPQPSVDAGKL